MNGYRRRKTLRGGMALVGLVVLAAAAGCGSIAPVTMMEGTDVRMISPKVVSIHTVDASSPETVVRGIIKAGMSPEEKALAIWEYCWKHTYHWPAPQEDLQRLHELDVVYDVSKQLNVYGYTYCFAIRSLAESLYEAAGLEARSAGIGGHLIAEVYYEGKYHYLDNDQRGFSRLADGTIASLEDCHGQAKELVLSPTGPSRPFFPSEKSPRVPYEQKHIFAGYLLNADKHYYQHDKYQTAHSMNLGLRPGERFVRYWSNTGRWHWFKGLTEEYKGNGYADMWEGPHDPYGELYAEAPRDEEGRPLSFGNGILVYRPDLSVGGKDYADGVCADENIDASGSGFGPTRAGRTATADFRVRLPYVIVGWPDVDKGGVTGAAVVSGRALRRTRDDQVRVLVSTDSGANWSEVWKAAEVGEFDFAVDVSALVEGRYSYLVRFALLAARERGDAAVLRLGIDTACQLNPAVLPAVRPGRNEMTVTFEAGPDVFEETVRYAPEALPRHERLMREMKGLKVEPEVKPGDYAYLAPAAGKTGYVVYEMAAPPGREIAWAKVGAAFRTYHDPTPDEEYRIYYAVDRPRGWKLIYEADQAPYLSHWCFEANREIRLERPVGRIFVKYELKRSARKGAEGGKLVAARLVWGCTGGARRAPAGGLRVSHVWKEDGAERRHSEVVTRNGEAYSFDVRAKRVENVLVAVEWAERPPSLGGPHPLMLERPKVERRELRDVEGVRGMLDALARLDKTPSAETAADILWNRKHTWTNSAVVASLMVFGGARAREELRKAVGKREWAEGCLLVLLANEGPTEELAEFLKRKEASMRAKAARLLGARGDVAALDAVRAALAKEDDGPARAAEAAALVRLGGKVRTVNNVTVLTFQEAERQLRDCSERGQVEVGAALAAAGAASGFEVLGKAMKSDNRYVRFAAANALAESGRAEAEPPLIRALSDESRWVRQAATAGLGRFGTKASLLALARVVGQDPEAYLRAEAGWAIAEIEKRFGR